MQALAHFQLINQIHPQSLPFYQNFLSGYAYGSYILQIKNGILSLNPTMNTTGLQLVYHQNGVQIYVTIDLVKILNGVDLFYHQTVNGLIVASLDAWSGVYDKYVTFQHLYDHLVSLNSGFVGF